MLNDYNNSELHLKLKNFRHYTKDFFAKLKYLEIVLETVQFFA